MSGPELLLVRYASFPLPLLGHTYSWLWRIHTESLHLRSQPWPLGHPTFLSPSKKKKKKLEKCEVFLITIRAYSVQKIAGCGSAAYSLFPRPGGSSSPDSPTNQGDPIALHSSPPPEQSPWMLGGPPQLG